MKILVAEDDLRLLKNIAFMLKKDLYQVDTAKNGEEALDLALDKNYDLVILDWMMPERMVSKYVVNYGKTVMGVAF